jgi:hypothetical protein
VTVLLLALAALAVGALVGFLFGIPRALSEDGPSGGAVGSSRVVAAGESGYRPSNNLEQVSDWLTKIIIGVGLVEFREVGGALASLGEVVTSASLPPAPGAGVVAQIVVVLFAAIGFLASFLWTRIYYGQLQFAADRGIYDMLRSIRSYVSQQGAETAEVKEIVGLIASGDLAPTATAPAAA